VGVQDISNEPAGKYKFFYGKGNENHELGTVVLSIRESNQQLRGSVRGRRTLYTS
jgi:hypothetical protein